ncbi:MAG: hypothetical protein IT569_06035 [Leptospiraceae bacterium]|nr:hypothetical protein [Leptospiraceae bacterium]
MADKREQESKNDIFSDVDPFAPKGNPKGSGQGDSGENFLDDLDLSLDDFPDIQSSEPDKEISYSEIDQMLGGESESNEDVEVDPGIEAPSLDDFSPVQETDIDSGSGDDLSGLIASSVDDSSYEEDEENSFDIQDDDKENFEFGEVGDSHLDLDLSDEEVDINEEPTFEEELNFDLEDDSIPLVDDELNQILESDDDVYLEETDNELQSEQMEGPGLSILDGDEDEPIALSPDELAHITADESIPKEEHDETLDEAFGDIDLGDDEGPIALSDEELDHILDSDESTGGSSILDSDEDEPIALSPDELAHITADESIQKEEEDDILNAEPFGDSDLSAGDDEGPIALSDEELDHILDSDESTGGSSILDSDEDEPIALSPDELAHITSDESIEKEEEEDLLNAEPFGDSDLSAGDDEGPIALSGEELDHILDSDETVGGSSILDSDEDEPIALSPDELAHITGDESVQKEEHDDILHTEPFGASDLSEEDEGPIALSGEELDHILETDEPIIKPSILDGDEEEPIALSPDELAHITEDESIQKEEHEDALDSELFGGTDLGVGDEEGPISLSDEELDHILDTDEPIIESSVFDGDEEEPIALSPDELAHITEDESTVEEEFDDTFGKPGTDVGESIALSDDEDLPVLDSDQAKSHDLDHALGDINLDEEGPIALSDDELDHILETDEPVSEAGTTQIGEFEDVLSVGEELSEPAEFDEEISLSDNELSNLLESDSTRAPVAEMEQIADSELIDIIGEVPPEETLA